MGFGRICEAQDSTRKHTSYIATEFLTGIASLSSGNPPMYFQPQVAIGTRFTNSFFIQVTAGYGQFKNEGLQYDYVRDYKATGYFFIVSPTVYEEKWRKFSLHYVLNAGYTRVKHEGIFSLDNYPIEVRNPIGEHFSTLFTGPGIRFEYFLHPSVSVHGEANVHYIWQRGQNLSPAFIPGAGYLDSPGNYLTLNLRGFLAYRF